MKNKLLKIALPTIALTFSIAPVVALSSCNKSNNVIRIPNKWLDIDNNILRGIKPEYEKQVNEKAYKLVVPKDITEIQERAFEPKTENPDYSVCAKIKEVSFAKGSICSKISDYAFSECVKLEKVVFPANYSQTSEFCFYLCENLKVLDFTNLVVENFNIAKSKGYNYLEGAEETFGTIYCKEDKKQIFEKLIEWTDPHGSEYNSGLYNWQIVTNK